MTTGADVTHLSAQIRAAAIQRRLLEPWLDDNRFLSEAPECQILYAVDSDVVALFIDPYTKSVGRDSNKQQTRHAYTEILPAQGYAEIIPDQDQRVSDAIGWILANFIFDRLPGIWPIFLLPPIETEVADSFNIIADRASRDHARALVSVRRIEEWVKASENTEITHNYFARNLPEILAVLSGGRSYSAQVMRFSRLLSSGKLYTPEQFLNTTQLPDEDIRDALRSPTGVYEVVQFSQMTETWLERLLVHAPKRRSRDRLMNDARMLARLEWINAKLVDKPYRFVLITGSQLLARAALDYVDGGWIAGASNFWDAYIRSPKAYLADRRVVSPVPEGPGGADEEESFVGLRLKDWLNTVLGGDERKSVAGNGDYRSRLEQLINATESELAHLASEKLDIDPALSANIREKWRAFTADVSAVNVRDEIEYRMGFLDSRAITVGEKVALLRAELDRNIRFSWDMAYEAALGSALTVRRARADFDRQLPARNLPRLYLDGHPATNAAIEHYLEAWQLGCLSRDVYRALRVAPDRDPPNRTYLGFLAQAYVLGATSRWQLSAVTAALAMSVARDYRESAPDDAKRNRISGREAAFWRAFSLRSSARDRADLKRARDALSAAREYMAEDLDDARGAPVNFRAVRFDAEQLAIDVTELCFEIFSEEGDVAIAPATYVEMGELRRYANLKLDDILRDCGAVPTVRNGGDPHYAISFQRIITNYFMLSLYMRPIEQIGSDDISVRLLQFAEVVEDARGGELKTLSFLVVIIYAAARSVFASDARARAEARSEFRALFRDSVENWTMPYDYRRFAYLAEIVAAARR